MPTAAPLSAQPTLRHLEQLIAQLLDGVILLDPTGTLLTANAAALAMHGVTEVSELGATADEYARRFTMWGAEHRLLRHREYPLFRVLAGEAMPDLIVEVAPAGCDEARWVHQVRDVVMDVDGGEPDYLAVVLCDVSKRFDAEARFRAMFRANPAPALIVRQRDLRIANANPGFLSLTGFAREQLVERSLFGLGLLGGVPSRAEVRGLIDAGAVIPQTEAELLCADGGRRLVIFAGQPIDVTEEDALLLTFADLQPRREAERSLASSERDLEAVFDMAPVAMVIADSAHRVLRVNAAFGALSGLAVVPGAGVPVGELGWWQNDEARETLERDVAEHGAVRAGEAEFVARDGSELRCSVAAERIGTGDATRVIWVYQDVTERRRSEAELADAIDAVLKDTRWLSRSILDKLATLRRPTPQLAPADLTARERQVLDLICDDLDDAEIAERLAITRNTVRNHVARIYEKTGATRRSGAVVWGRERGMGTHRA
ncbi:PAS domain S-box protein [Sphingomonas sp. RHCKR7]|uniref:PAS domain S-box protein n=1 Tax=Sphingomonas folli TaxID=2862497 RepID=UPI001CA47C4E|nr:PAS domain S-box protein [Sphingomonas folli]MBW6526363.1 PAS domain S-box protein [Sphingomonas folli]